MISGPGPRHLKKNESPHHCDLLTMKYT
jgi:hypothetical protein